ncbi:unnamed protein product [Amoebophrya sp. A120]|nr:unnamed protein product [Amoebophrya sp. A120]|eukprot:GSA120T00020225001.1
MLDINSTEYSSSCAEQSPVVFSLNGSNLVQKPTNRCSATVFPSPLKRNKKYFLYLAMSGLCALFSVVCAVVFFCLGGTTGATVLPVRNFSGTPSPAGAGASPDNDFELLPDSAEQMVPLANPKGWWWLKDLQLQKDHDHDTVSDDGDRSTQPPASPSGQWSPRRDAGSPIATGGVVEGAASAGGKREGAEAVRRGLPARGWIDDLVAAATAQEEKEKAQDDDVGQRLVSNDVEMGQEEIAKANASWPQAATPPRQQTMGMGKGSAANDGAQMVKSRPKDIVHVHRNKAEDEDMLPSPDVMLSRRPAEHDSEVVSEGQHHAGEKKSEAAAAFSSLPSQQEDAEPAESFLLEQSSTSLLDLAQGHSAAAEGPEGVPVAIEKDASDISPSSSAIRSDTSRASFPPVLADQYEWHDCSAEEDLAACFAEKVRVQGAEGGEQEAQEWSLPEDSDGINSTTNDPATLRGSDRSAGAGGSDLTTPPTLPFQLLTETDCDGSSPPRQTSFSSMETKSAAIRVDEGQGNNCDTTTDSTSEVPEEFFPGLRTTSAVGATQTNGTEEKYHTTNTKESSSLVANRTTNASSTATSEPSATKTTQRSTDVSPTRVPPEQREQTLEVRMSHPGLPPANQPQNQLARTPELVNAALENKPQTLLDEVRLFRLKQLYSPLDDPLTTTAEKASLHRRWLAKAILARKVFGPQLALQLMPRSRRNSLLTRVRNGSFATFPSEEIGKVYTRLMESVVWQRSINDKPDKSLSEEEVRIKKDIHLLELDILRTHLLQIKRSENSSASTCRGPTSTAGSASATDTKPAEGTATSCTGTTSSSSSVSTTTSDESSKKSTSSHLFHLTEREQTIIRDVLSAYMFLPAATSVPYTQGMTFLLHELVLSISFVEEEAYFWLLLYFLHSKKLTRAGDSGQYLVDQKWLLADEIVEDHSERSPKIRGTAPLAEHDFLLVDDSSSSQGSSANGAVAVHSSSSGTNTVGLHMRFLFTVPFDYSRKMFFASLVHAFPSRELVKGENADLLGVANGASDKIFQRSAVVDQEDFLPAADPPRLPVHDKIASFVQSTSLPASMEEVKRLQRGERASRSTENFAGSKGVPLPRSSNASIRKISPADTNSLDPRLSRSQMQALVDQRVRIFPRHRIFVDLVHTAASYWNVGVLGDELDLEKTMVSEQLTVVLSKIFFAQFTQLLPAPVVRLIFDESLRENAYEPSFVAATMAVFDLIYAKWVFPDKGGRIDHGQNGFSYAQNGYPRGSAAEDQISFFPEENQLRSDDPDLLALSMQEQLNLDSVTNQELREELQGIFRDPYAYLSDIPFATWRFAFFRARATVGNEIVDSAGFMDRFKNPPMRFVDSVATGLDIDRMLRSQGTRGGGDSPTSAAQQAASGIVSAGKNIFRSMDRFASSIGGLLHQP